MTGRQPRRPLLGQPDGRLADGSPLYGQLGTLAVDEQAGTVQCAACGRWLNTVSGSHLVAAHGLTARRLPRDVRVGVADGLSTPPGVETFSETTTR